MDLDIVRTKVIGKSVVAADNKINDQMFRTDQLLEFMDYFLQPELAEAYKHWYKNVPFIGAYTDVASDGQSFNDVWYEISRNKPSDFEMMLSGFWGTSKGGQFSQNLPKQVEHHAIVLGMEADRAIDHITTNDDIILFNNNDDRIDGGSIEYQRELRKVILAETDVSVGIEDPGYGGDIYEVTEDQVIIVVYANVISLLIN